MSILISILHTLLPHLIERFKMVAIPYSHVCSPLLWRSHKTHAFLVETNFVLNFCSINLTKGDLHWLIVIEIHLHLKSGFIGIKKTIKI